MSEIFRPSANFGSHYEVSTLGNIRRTKPGKGTRLLKNFNKPRTGYHTVRLCIDGVPFTVSVHREVVETFLRKMEPGECVNHLDGNPLNNELSNLEITSYSGNTRHAVDVLGWRPTAKKGERNGRALITDAQAQRAINAKRNTGELKELAEELGVSMVYLYNIRNGRRWMHLRHPP